MQENKLINWALPTCDCLARGFGTNDWGGLKQWLRDEELHMGCAWGTLAFGLPGTE